MHIGPIVRAVENKPSNRLAAWQEDGIAPWSKSLWPLLRAEAAADAVVLQLGSAYTLQPEASCDFCFVRYRPELPHALRGVSCTIEPQAKVGVVGRTGSGKTTFVSTLWQLVEPSGVCSGSPAPYAL